MGFFDAFTGASQKKTLAAADRKATAALDQGYGQTQGYYNQAASAYDPYVQQGTKASGMYNDLLGLNGADARSAAQGVITSDPLFQGGLAADSNALLRQLNARGQSAGGLSAIAGQRVLQQNYGNWLDRYNQAGQQGLQATGAQSGVRMAQGDNAFNYGATKAGQAINYGNARAEAQGIGVNNLFNLAGTGIRAYAAMNGVPKR